MFSPVSRISTNNTITGNTVENNANAPFDIKWLAEHFNFSCDDVKKAQFDSMGLMFEVHFKPGKELIAEQFYNNLVSKGCHPRHSKYNNSVSLNKHQKDKILFAGSSASMVNPNHFLVSQKKEEKINPTKLTDTLATRDQILTTHAYNMSLPEKKWSIPFDLYWLQKNYKLDLKYVETAELNSIFH